MNYEKLAKQLNELTNEKHIIRIGRYTGNYYLGNDKFKKISGDFFIMTNNGNLFRVVSDESDIIDDFDIIEDNAIIKPINKKKENNSLSYDLVDFSNKEDLRAYFPNDEIGIEMFEYTQSIPVRFREDALEVFINPKNRNIWNMKTVNQVWSYFLEEIIDEMTEEEKRIYKF